MGKYIEGEIECPFYIREGEGFITCEGILSRNDCKHTFCSDSAKKRYETVFCCVDGGKNCAHHKAVLKLYETGKRV